MGLSLPERFAGKMDNANPKIIPGMLKPTDVAGMISYLLSDESRFVTKAVYRLDGGCTG